MSDIIPTLHSPDEIRAIQRNVYIRSTFIDSRVRACPQIDDATRGSWGIFYIRCRDWSSAEVPSQIHVLDLNTMFEQGLSLVGQIDEWQAKLEAAGCAIPWVLPPKRQGPFDYLKEIGSVVGGVLTAAAIAAGVVYGAPVVASWLKKRD